MTGMALRNVSYSTLVTKVPEAAVRARFQSLSSSVQHALVGVRGHAFGAADGARAPRPAALRRAGRVPFELTGMQNVAAVSMALTAHDSAAVVVGRGRARSASRTER